MGSNNPASGLTLALATTAEQGFEDAVVDILANNGTIVEKIARIHESAADAKQEKPSCQVACLTVELEEHERCLIAVCTLGKAICTGQLASEIFESTCTQQKEAIQDMMDWLADELVPGDGNSSKMSAQNLVLFRAVARWLFWRSCLGEYGGRVRFCSMLAGGPHHINIVKQMLPRLLEQVKVRLELAITTLKVDPYVNVLVSTKGSRKRGSRGRRKKANKATTTAESPSQVDEPEQEIVRSLAPFVSLEQSGAIVGVSPVVEVSLTPDGPRADVILDTGCPSTTIDLDFLRYMHPGAEIKRLPRPWTAAGVVPNAFRLIEHYATLDVHVDGLTRDQRHVRVHISQEVTVIKDYNMDMLIGMDMIKAHGIAIFPDHDALNIRACDNVLVRFTSRMHSFSQVVDDAKEEERRMRNLRKVMAKTRVSGDAE